jgi:hypothetical protein
MREFSQTEQAIIKDHLISGAGLSAMLPNVDKIKWLITYDGESDLASYNFRSDQIEAQPAYNALVEMIELLKYLVAGGLVRKQNLAATVEATMEDMTHKRTISLGNSASNKNVAFIPSDGLEYAHFIFDNENTRFVALAPLVEHSRNDFISPEDRRHYQQLRQTRTANIVSIIVGTFSILFGVYSSYQNNLSQADLILLQNGVSLAKEAHLSDSLKLDVLQRESRSYASRLDSIRHMLKMQNEVPMEKTNPTKTKKTIPSSHP